MANDNFIDIKISPEDLKISAEGISVAKSVMQKYLISLTPLERTRLLKLGDKTIPFVEKVIEYASTNPKLVPDFMNLENLQTDYKAVNDLNTILRPLEQLVNGIKDTIAKSGGECFSASLVFYNYMKQATANGVPDAETIYDDLKKRFEKTKPKSSKKD